MRLYDMSSKGFKDMTSCNGEARREVVREEHFAEKNDKKVIREEARDEFPRDQVTGE